MQKKQKAALIVTIIFTVLAVLAACFAVMLLSSLSDGFDSTDNGEKLGTAIASVVILPVTLISATVSAVFSTVGVMLMSVNLKAYTGGAKVGGIVLLSADALTLIVVITKIIITFTVGL